MAPRRPPATGFCGVRRRESGRYAAEITCDGDRLWLGTFDTPELTARVYDAVASMYGRKPAELNFPEDAKHAWFLAPPYRMYSRKEEKARRLAKMDEEYMARYAEANPQLVAEERDFWANKEKEQRKKEDAEMDARISAEVDQLFDELDEEGYFMDDDGEVVQPATRTDGEAGPSGGRPEVVDLVSEDEDED